MRTLIIAAMIICINIPANRAEASEFERPEFESRQLSSLVESCLDSIHNGSRKSQERAMNTLIDIQSYDLMVYLLTSEDTSIVFLQFLQRQEGTAKEIGLKDLPWLLDAAMVWANRIGQDEQPGDTLRAKGVSGQILAIAKRVLEYSQTSGHFESDSSGYYEYTIEMLNASAIAFKEAENAESGLWCEWLSQRLRDRYGPKQDIETGTDPENE